jgi:hypothetical protein
MRALALSLATCAPLLLEGCNGCNDQQLVKDTDVGVDEEPPMHDIGQWLSMKPMPDGRPAISYYDRDSGALGFAIGTIQSDGTVKWATEEVDSYPDENGLNPGDAGKYTSLLVDPEGIAWISYQDITNGSLKYAKRDGAGAWTVGIADVGGGAHSDAGYWTSIGLDASKHPVIAHFDHGQGALRVARWNGSAFTGSVIYDGEDYVPADSGAETIPGDAGEYAKLYVANDGTEYIAFYDRARGALRLAKGGPTGYTNEIVDDDGDVGQWPDIVQTSTGFAIAYQDVTNQHLKLATGAPGNWAVETIDSAPYTGSDTAIYAGSNGSVNVLYFDGVNNDMKLARQVDGAWTSETVTGAGVASGFHNETMESEGVRYAACYDYTNRGIWFSALP